MTPSHHLRPISSQQRTPAVDRWTTGFALALLLLFLNSARATEVDLTAVALELLAARGVSSDDIAFAVRGPAVVARHRAQAAMPPASCQKLLTVAAFLERLGSEQVIATDLLRTGPLRAGVLEGDLIVVGRGDPGRVSSDGSDLGLLEKWVDLVAQLGIEQVRGRLIGDDSFFAGPSRHPDWPQREWSRWYSAPVGALNLNDNCIDLHLLPVRAVSSGFDIQITTVPVSRLLKIRNQLLAVRKAGSHAFRVDRAPGSWQVIVRGKFHQGRAKAWVHSVAVPDPTLAYLDAFRQMLAARGILVAEGVARGPVPGNATLVDRSSQAVVAWLPRLLKKSQNMLAEALFRQLDRQAGAGDGDGSFVSSAKTLTAILRQEFELSGPLRIRDGSGLSRQNRVTADGLLRVLERAQTRPWGAFFAESLAVGGRDGTLKRRFRVAGLRDKVRAKTGHLTGVATLSGYLETPQGTVVFSLLYEGPARGRESADRWMEDFLVRVAAEASIEG